MSHACYLVHADMIFWATRTCFLNPLFIFAEIEFAAYE